MYADPRHPGSLNELTGIRGFRKVFFQNGGGGDLFFSVNGPIPPARPGGPGGGLPFPVSPPGSYWVVYCRQLNAFYRGPSPDDWHPDAYMASRFNDLQITNALVSLNALQPCMGQCVMQRIIPG